MLRIREIKPNIKFEASGDVRSFDVTLVHEFDYGDVTVKVRIANKSRDADVLNIAIETAYEEIQELARLPIPVVTIAAPDPKSEDAEQDKPQ